MDTTTLYFESRGVTRSGGDGLKLGLPAVPQSDDTWGHHGSGLGASEMWSGNTADVTTLLPVVDRQRRSGERLGTLGQRGGPRDPSLIDFSAISRAASTQSFEREPRAGIEFRALCLRIDRLKSQGSGIRCQFSRGANATWTSMDALDADNLYLDDSVGDRYSRKSVSSQPRTRTNRKTATIVL
jgi:hypothetical protein